MPRAISALTSCLATLTLWAIAHPAAAKDPLLQDFRLYGHFSPSVISFNDGVGRHSNVADNAYSGGRIGFWMDIPARRGLTRFNVETSLGIRSSAGISQLYLPPLIDLNASTIRKFEIIRDTERYGSFSFGLGSMGSDAVTESDLSGTQLAAYVGLSDTAGGYFFRTAAGTLSAVDVGSAFPTFDGGRAPRLRWDSPDLALSRFGTFNVAVSFGVEVSDRNVVINDSLADIGVFYRNRFKGLEIKASGGFSLAEVNGQQAPQSAGSLSLRHAGSGWSATVAGGARESGGSYYYSKIGLTRRWIDWGDTALSLDLYRGMGTFASASRASSIGIGLVQDLDRSGLQFYVGLRQYEVDQPGVVSYRDSRSVIFGTRWVFKELDNLHLRRGRSEVDWRDSE